MTSFKRRSRTLLISYKRRRRRPPTTSYKRGRRLMTTSCKGGATHQLQVSTIQTDYNIFGKIIWPTICIAYKNGGISQPRPDRAVL